jgi:internalin A
MRKQNPIRRHPASKIRDFSDRLLAPLKGLTALRSLDCQRTRVRDLAPLNGLLDLQSLNCSNTRVSDLTPLSGLLDLQSLNCSDTRVSDLTPLTGLPDLQSLNCSYTRVSDLTALRALFDLQSLDCSYTQVGDLTPLTGLTRLRSLTCNGVNLAALPEWFAKAPTIRELHFHQARIASLPVEVLSTSWAEDCLPKLRAYFFDKKDGVETVAQEDKPETAPLAFGAERSATPRFYVSYAWADPTDPERERIVDQACEEAEKRGTPIIRDKTTLSFGDNIAKFMRAIGEGDRIFVVLSEKYLKSPFCMFESFEIWRNSRQDKAEFLHRVRIYALGDAKIWKPLDRVRYARYWKNQHEELRAAVDEAGLDVLGEEDLRSYKLMQDFASKVGDILALFANIVQPRSFDDLKTYGFDDPPPTGSARAPSQP